MATQIDALDQSGSNTIRSILILAVCHVLTGFWPALPDLIAADLPTPLETFLRTVDLNVNESEVVPTGWRRQRNGQAPEGDRNPRLDAAGGPSM